MKTENKLSKLFNADKEKKPVSSDQLVDDPRIDSPEIKVIRPEQLELSKEVMEKPSEVIEPAQPKEKTDNVQKNKTTTGEEDKTYDQGFLEEFEVVANKQEKTEEPHVCKVSFGDAFKEHWLWFSAIILIVGVGCLALGRVTKKMAS